ncbi:hypothetical protein [Flexithrix dorotheae]|uniref:hypothetical protein n=1 Tax=Flexithrix dorotheae TaxID=70993 RepID=UPI000360B40B|nr:hypothetical protein [Flexithrix dorotheae]
MAQQVIEKGDKIANEEYGIKPAYPQEYEWMISVGIVLGAVLIIGFTILAYAEIF